MKFYLDHKCEAIKILNKLMLIDPTYYTPIQENTILKI